MKNKRQFGPCRTKDNKLYIYVCSYLLFPFLSLYDLGEWLESLGDQGGGDRGNLMLNEWRIFV